MRKKKIKVAVGLSGGVDSSVAAALLKQQGYEVLGVFLHFWSESIEGKIRDNICCSLESQEDARRVCQKLDMPFYTLNMETPFKERIVDEFLREYENCRTPNPCVRCNQYIKFGEMWHRLRTMGVEYVATGHYARIREQILRLPATAGFPQDDNLISHSVMVNLPNHQDDRGVPIKLLKGKDQAKDQSYFLHQVTQEQLAHTLFPIGDLTKTEVRALAKQFDLPTARKVESQEICFIPAGDTAEFLQRYLTFTKGEIRDLESNRVLGPHQGLALYTIGQRKGIRLAGGPWYVVGFNKEENSLLVSRDEEKIYRSNLVVEAMNWIAGAEPILPLKTKCRIRSQASEVDCSVSKSAGGKYRVDFAQPQRAVTPGQYCVFYDGDECLGGGVIC